MLWNRKKRLTLEKAKASVLFVCMGNICRSPTAEGVFRKCVEDAGLADDVFIDSAGTHAYHQGEPPDRRAREAAGRRGVTLDGQAARRVVETDFERFDFIIAMDRLNRETLIDRAEPESHEKIRLMLEYASVPAEDDVPDPYYGGTAGFERVLDLVEDAAEGLLAQVRARC